MEAAGAGYARATLVVCPLVAVLQWRQEIERFTVPNTLKACGPSFHMQCFDYNLESCSCRCLVLAASSCLFAALVRDSWPYLAKLLQVVVFHGAKRAADAAELAKADVVLTTYAIIEGEHRRYCQPMRVPCEYCRKKFTPERLEVHLRCMLSHGISPLSMDKTMFSCAEDTLYSGHIFNKMIGHPSPKYRRRML